ncbi:MAG TPA: SDR family NAD(P)-dependent oxidoreductase, partial [Candidatus Binatia bacterium]|nr:SDR family NAD(P)-dependent oxidoreductase [Candidatus Binatia bacterium]
MREPCERGARYRRRGSAEQHRHPEPPPHSPPPRPTLDAAPFKHKSRALANARDTESLSADGPSCTATPVTRSFDGAVAIVTGAASGIGRALSDELARRGSTVVLADLQRDEADAAAAALR